MRPAASNGFSLHRLCMCESLRDLSSKRAALGLIEIGTGIGKVDQEIRVLLKAKWEELLSHRSVAVMLVR